MAEATAIIDLIGLSSEIGHHISRFIAKQINIAIKKNLSSIAKEVRAAFIDAARRHPTYASLQNGELRAHLGLPSQTTVDDFLTQLVQLIEVEYETMSLGVGTVRDGIFKIFLPKGAFESLIKDTFVTSKRGTQLLWADWLLVQGDKIIIDTHRIKFTDSGRSGGAIMIKHDSGWGVPTEHAGTLDNNWLTKSWGDEKMQTQVKSIIFSHIPKRM